jgi:hypothetical protein
LESFGAAWNESDATVRDCLLSRSFASDGTYIDPSVVTHDRASLSDHIGGIRGQFAGALLSWVGPIIRGSDLRAQWTFGTQLGIDYQELGADGLIAAVSGFWEPFTDTGPLTPVDDYVSAWNSADVTARTNFLATAVADSVLFRDGTQDASGSGALAAAMTSARSGGLESSAAVKLQSYGAPPTHARLVITLTNSDGSTVDVTDYLRFDTDGRILRIGRFMETP